jgi:outer membrane receptor protein involved in Fe transport
MAARLPADGRLAVQVHLIEPLWRVPLVVLPASLTAAGPLLAQTPPSPPAATRPPAQQPPADQDAEEAAKYEETVVVSASRSEGKLIDAPASMSVITSGMLENVPTQNFAWPAAG